MRTTKRLIVLSAIVVSLTGYGCGDGDAPERDAARPLPGGNSDVGATNNAARVENDRETGTARTATPGDPSGTAPGAAGSGNVNRSGTDNTNQPSGSTGGGGDNSSNTTPGAGSGR